MIERSVFTVISITTRGGNSQHSTVLFIQMFLIELFQHVIIMMSSNIKRTRAEPGVQLFSEEALERLSPYAEQVASDAKER